MKVRLLGRQGFVCLDQLRLTSRDAISSAGTVGQAMACDRHQPRRDGTFRIVSVADGMNSQQDILHPILDLISTEAAATGESSQIGGYRLEERKIGTLVATLAARHQRRPI